LIGALDNRLYGGSPERFGYSWTIYNSILPEHKEQSRGGRPLFPSMFGAARAFSTSGAAWVATRTGHSTRARETSSPSMSMSNLSRALVAI
jgi:hypothetical protein